MKYFAGMVLMLVSHWLWAQTDPFNNFSGLQASGPIPADFSSSWADKFYENPVNLDLEEDISELSLEEFWINQNHAIDVLLSSGKFSFGDPVTTYINQVADKVLAKRPELRKKVRFYLYKDPSANAFCVADGLIGVNNGLIANLRSEAELAFVLAHEVSHFLEGHIFEDYFKEQEKSDGSVEVLEDIESRLKRSRGQELEADSVGLRIFLESGYESSAISGALISLYESYHPFGRCEVGGNPLSHNNAYQLPEWAVKRFQDSILDDYDYLSLGHGHPNIAQRLEEVNQFFFDAAVEVGQLFLVSEQSFYNARKWARFENVKINLIQANFTEALYEIHCLEEKYPNNKFLALSKMRALYGLAAYKIRARYHEVVPVPSALPGPIKDLSYTLFQLNKYELIGIAVRLANDLMEDYPANMDLKTMRLNLHRMWYSHSALDSPELLFAQNSEIPERSRLFLNRILPDYQLKESVYLEDFNTDISYQDSVNTFIPEILIDDPETSRDDYYYYQNNFVIDENFTGLYVLDPIVFVDLDGADEDDRFNSLDCEEALIEELPEMLLKENFGGQVLHSEFFDEQGVEGYNLLCQLKSFRGEARIYESLHFPTARAELSEELGLEYPYITTIIGLIRPGERDYYFFNVINLKTGKTVSQQIVDEGRALLASEFVRSTKRNLKDLKE